MTTIKMIDNRPNDNLDGLDRIAISSSEYASLNRLVNISCLATFIRSFSIECLNDDEIRIFLDFQNYVIALEARCFEEAGFE